MEIELLRTLLILAQTKNFSKTAELQHIVQSTVTTRVRELEKDVGEQLFLRSKQKVELTEAGAVFLPYAERMLRLYEEGKFKAKSTTSFEGRLVVGSVDSIWRNILFPVLQEYLVRYPRISFKATTGHSLDVLQRLVDGVIDIALVYQPPRLSRFKVYACHEEDFVLVVHPQHPLACHAEVSVSELSQMNLLYHNWSGAFTQWIHEILPPNQLFQVQIDTAQLILALVKQGLGPAILSRAAVAAELNANTIVEIPLTGANPPPRWITYAVVHPGKLSEQPVSHWLDLMSEYNLKCTL
ncbi:LysR family transcriptional regulator [Acetonema longum]|uniref:Transcriptional regulator n=1 Tax=Acetonema longum DSM 6540 TaxID=1009370 RepID=F7NM33_9FIRM|nr:LysR family transcriptional regulator [Acetonema longum]EGO62888.1 transcriptional regulator [Acetonema longum DSM 6540]